MGSRTGAHARLRLRTVVSSLLTAALFTSAAACSPGGGRSSGSSEPEATPTPSQEDFAAYGAIDVTLHVEEMAGLARTNEPVRSGVPVPRAAALFRTEHLVVVDDEDNLVPAQVRVTSRWEGMPDDESKPVKWLLVDFPADVAVGQDRIYRLRSRDTAAPTAPSLVAENDASRIVVDTGAARFELSKLRFNLFDSVTLENGKRLVASDPNAGAYLIKPDGVRFSAAAGTTSVEVEEEGAQRVVVVARGKHASGSTQTLNWTMRVHFFAGRADALVAYTFTDRDLPAITNYVPVDEMGIDVPLAHGAGATWTFGGENAAHAGALGGEAFLRQTGNLSEAMSATFNPGGPETLRYSNGGLATGNGGKAPGWMDVTGADGGMTVAMRWFWQQYPKKLAARPGSVSVEIWPSEDPNMRVYAASQKTHEMLFSFHDGQTTGAQAGPATHVRIDAPLVARCNPSWYAQSRVWNRIGTAELENYKEEHRSTVEKYFQNLMGSEYAKTFVDIRNHGKGMGHAYSMWDFGDSREDKWSNMAYDTPRSLMIHWAITGDRAFYDRGMEGALHMRDVDTEHSELDTRAGVYGARGVSKPWLGRSRYTPTRGPQSHDLGYKGGTTYGFEHQKGQGFADHYFLTGDMMSKEVLAQSYHYYEQWLKDAESGYLRTDGSRVVSHMLLVMMGYYDAYGTEEARGRIDYIVDYLDDWQRRTSGKDPDGQMWTTDSDVTSTFMNGVTAEALMLYETMFPEGIPVRENLVDAAKWTVNPSKGQLVNGSQGHYFNAWTGHNYGVSHATVLDAMIVPMLGYAADALGDQEMLDLSKEVLSNNVDQDQSSPYMKAFTEQTRLVPAYLYWLQTDEARGEGSTSGFSGT